MKKIFTLLFCVVALTAAANTDARVEQCINVLLGNPASTQLMAANVGANLDADNDGMITIADVSALIDLNLQAQVNRAPAQEIDIDALAKEVVESPTGKPDISDLNEAIDENLKNK